MSKVKHETFVRFILRAFSITFFCFMINTGNAIAQGNGSLCGMINAIVDSQIADTVLLLNRSTEETVRLLDMTGKLGGCEGRTAFGKKIVIVVKPSGPGFVTRPFDVKLDKISTENGVSYRLEFQQIGTGQVGSIYFRKRGTNFVVYKCTHTRY